MAALATSAGMAGPYSNPPEAMADLDERAAEVRGVTLTYKLTKPRPSEVAEGAGIFSYEFRLHNPGRLPITEVNVDMQYPGPVRRIQSDRVRTVGPEKAHSQHVHSVSGSARWIHLDVALASTD